MKLRVLLPLLALVTSCSRGPVAVSATGSSTASSNARRAAVGIRTNHEQEWLLHEKREPAAAWAERLGPSAISDFGDGIPVEHWIGDEGRGHEEKWVVKDNAGNPLVETDSYYSGIHYSTPDGAREEKTLFVEYDWSIPALRIHYFGDPFDPSDPIPAIAASNTVEAAAAVLSLWGLPLDSAATNAPAAGTEPLPFSVAFKPAHPFLAEYDRWIDFPSGKRIGIWMDTGGAGPFAVYRLASGAYYLIDGLKFEYIRSEYRVDPAAETVEIMNGTRWIAIPDGASAVVGHSSDSIIVKTKHGETTVGGGVPVGDSLAGRTYLGLAKPDGRFEPGTGDPYAAQVDPPWTVVALPGSVPFRLEFFDHRQKGARVVFPDGKTRILSPLFRTEVFELHALDGGAFLLVDPSEVEWNFAKYRVDPGNETLEVLHADAWFEIPEEATGISGFSKTRGTPGTPRRAVMTIETADGKKDVERSTPAGNPPERTTFLGTIRPDGSFTPAAAKKLHAESAEFAE